MVIDVIPDHVPIARPRSAPEKETPINARLFGNSSAPPLSEDVSDYTANAACFLDDDPRVR
jgi:hypothetical protein